MLAPLLALAAAQGSPDTLRHAAVHAEVADHRVTVDATYEVSGTDRIALDAIRVGGGVVRLENVRASGPQVRVDTLPGLLRLTVWGGAEDLMRVTLHYQVIGDGFRIPLFVPSAPADPSHSSIRLVVAGLPLSVNPRTAVPRFAHDPSGTLTASPHHLPSFITLPGAPGPSAVARASEWLVVLVSALGTAYWLIRRRRARRQPESAD